MVDNKKQSIRERIIDQLCKIVSSAHVLTTVKQTEGFTHDYTGRWHSKPLAVVRPGSVEEVSRILQVASDYEISVTPQGGNTSLVGGAIGSDDGILLSLTRLQEWEIDVPNRTLFADAGVTLADAQRYAKAQELLFPVNTASRESATLGGIIATNAGGTRAVRWGVTRKHLLGLEVVLADGTIVQRLRPLTRDNVGYDLPQLFAGSEGTLGVITKTLFQLQPISLADYFVILAPVDSLAQACEFTTQVRSHGLALEAAEFMTHSGALLVSEQLAIPLPFPETVYTILVEFSTRSPDPFLILEDIFTQVFLDSQQEQIIVEPSPAPKLWKLRESHTEAINKTTRTPVIKLDISVPLASLDEYISSIDEVIVPFSPARAVCFGHFAEGNVHTNILDSRSEDYYAISTAVFSLVQKLGGSISAEHGIGRAKNQWISFGRSAADLAAMKAIRASFDPMGILSPDILQF